MAVVNNTASAIGDVLLIRVEIPIIGLSSISGFVDSVVGVTPTRYFEKYFRYSVDGLNWSLWLPLTDSNLQEIDINPTDFFLIEYKYIRSGTDTTGLLEFDSIQLLGTSSSIGCPESYQNSIFSQFFSCYSVDVLRWCLNVLEKVYKKGIVPKYIERGTNQNLNWEDRDFIDFWRTISCYFAVIVNYGRQFQNFPNHYLLLSEYLRSRGVFVSETEDVEDLLYIMKYFWDEVRKRGTLKIGEQYQAVDVDQSSSSSSGGSTNLLNGELLRLISKKEFDEFIFCYAEPWKVGWNVGNSSPMYRGTNFFFNAIKSWEKSEDVIDINNYPIYTTESPTNIFQSSDGSKTGVILINPFSVSGGYGGIGMSTFDREKAILIDPNVDYEITFQIKKTGNLAIFDFGVMGFTVDGIQQSFFNIVTGAPTSLFFQNRTLNQQNRYYFIRGIIYRQSQPNLSSADGQLKIGFGTNLKFSKSIKYICPTIYSKYIAGGGKILLWDVKVRPLRRDEGSCFVGIKNYLLTWVKNNTTRYSESEIEMIMSQKLLPYNLPFKNKYL